MAVDTSKSLYLTSLAVKMLFNFIC